MRGDYPRAREHFEHSLQLRTEVDDLPGMIVSNNNLGYLWQLQSEYERAIEQYQVAEELAKKINLRYARGFCGRQRGACADQLGRIHRCRGALQRSADDRARDQRAA